MLLIPCLGTPSQALALIFVSKFEIFKSDLRIVKCCEVLGGGSGYRLSKGKVSSLMYVNVC